MNLDHRVCIPEHVLVRKLDNELIILNLETEKYLGLDEVGTQFLETLSATPCIRDACTRLLGEFEVEESLLLEDMEQLLKELIAEGIVELQDGTSEPPG